jgi:AcrR family transcriptional regulator
VTEQSTEQRGRPRSVEADRAILRETVRLLAEQGYSAMSVEGVAAAAGVSKATIYRRYKGKRELVVAAIASLIREVAILPDTGDVRTDLLTGMRETFQMFGQINAFSLIGTLLVQERQDPGLLALFREQVIMPRRAAVRELLERGVTHGKLRPDADLDAMMESIIGSVFARHLSGLPMDEAWMESIVDQALRGAGTADERMHNV